MRIADAARRSRNGRVLAICRGSRRRTSRRSIPVKTAKRCEGDVFSIRRLYTVSCVKEYGQFLAIIVTMSPVTFQ